MKNVLELALMVNITVMIGLLEGNWFFSNCFLGKFQK